MVQEETRDKSSPGRRRSALRSGLVTGLAFLVLGGSGAAAAALLAQKFGRTAQTDGLLAGYAVYLVLAIAAQSFRLVVVPQLTRAVAAGRLAAETRAYGASLLLVAVPAVALAAAFRHPLGGAITGSLPHAAASTAARALPWFVASAFLQLLGGLCASALAAVDSYEVAAAATAAGGVAGLVFFVIFANAHGVVALAWGLALNGALALGIPLAVLGARGLLTGGEAAALEPLGRLWSLVQGAILPIAFQGFYLIALRLAAALGVGEVTSLSYAYVLGATLVTMTAFALGLVASAPLTRRGLDAESAVAHVVHSAWVSLTLVGAAAGIFAVVGGRIVQLVLGSAYGGDVGASLGRLVVELSPWMVVAATFYGLFPLVFVMDVRRVLVPLAIASVGVDVGVSYGFRSAWGLGGLAVALAVPTGLVVFVLLWELSRRALLDAALALARLSLVVAAAAVAGFWFASLVVGAVPAAVVGTTLYALLLLAARPLGLGEAWAYVRALH